MTFEEQLNSFFSEMEERLNQVSAIASLYFKTSNLISDLIKIGEDSDPVDFWGDKSIQNLIDSVGALEADGKYIFSEIKRRSNKLQPLQRKQEILKSLENHRETIEEGLSPLREIAQNHINRLKKINLDSDTKTSYLFGLTRILNLNATSLFKEWGIIND